VANAGFGYIAADILGIRLYHEGKDLWGAERKDFQVGPWEYSLWLEANGFTHGKECGVFVKVTKRVWLYVMLMPLYHGIAVFDAEKANLAIDGGSSKDVKWLNGKSCEAVMKELMELGAVKKTFEYKQGKWVVEHDAKVFAGAGK